MTKGKKITNSQDKIKVKKKKLNHRDVVGKSFPGTAVELDELLMKKCLQHLQRNQREK